MPTNIHSGEKWSYKVWNPVVAEFCKKTTPKLFHVMHIMNLEAQKTQGDGQNMHYQAAKLLTEAFTYMAAEKEPEININIRKI